MNLHKQAEMCLSHLPLALTTELLNERNDVGNTVWHIAAKNGTLKDIPKELFTEEAMNQINSDEKTVWHIAAASYNSFIKMPLHLLTETILNKKDKFERTVLHEAAENNTLKYIPLNLFTKNGVEQRNKHGENVLHTAAEFNSLCDIPKHLMIKEVLDIATRNTCDTVWHVAAKNTSLKHIPKHLFTEESLNYKNMEGETVWHVAAWFDTFKYIPKHFFSEKVMNQKNNDGHTVWQTINYVSLQDVPKHLINNKLPNMNPAAVVYINKVLQERLNYNIFIEKHPELERDVEFRDSRLVVKEAIEDRLIFKFDVIDADETDPDIILNKFGAYMDTVNHGTLSKVVQFIEENYENIEQSISLPKNSLTVENFVL